MELLRVGAVGAEVMCSATEPVAPGAGPASGWFPAGRNAEAWAKVRGNPGGLAGGGESASWRESVVLWRGAAAGAPWAGRPLPGLGRWA